MDSLRQGPAALMALALAAQTIPALAQHAHLHKTDRNHDVHGGWLHPMLPVAPFPSGFTMVETRDILAPVAARPAATVARPRDIPAELGQCWSPRLDAGEDTQEVTLRLQFNRDGGVIGAPLVSYARALDRDAAVRKLLVAINLCTPLKFTDGLGSAIAGYPFAIRFVATRGAHDDETKDGVTR